MSYTWEQVSAEWSKAEQMGFQSVLQAAHVGTMLIELRDGLPQVEFVQRAGQEAGIAKSQAFNLMTLARHLPLLQQHQPDSQRKALEIIKAQQPQKPKAVPSPKVPEQLPTPQPAEEKEEMKKGGYVGIAQRHGLISAATGSKSREKIRDRIEEIAPGAIESQDAVRIEEACRIIAVEKDPSKAQREAEEMKNELPDSWQKKFDKALRARLDVEIVDMQKQFDEQLRESRAELEALRSEAWTLKQNARAEYDAAAEYRMGIDSHMTMEEFQMVRNCLHPDRAPQDRRERFEKAFVIFNRLEKTVNTKAPIAILRRNGWEKASPFYKPH